MFRRIVVFAIPIFLIGFTVSLLYKWNYIQHEQKTPDEFSIPHLRTDFDANKNGKDDLWDVLQGAKDYISRNPQYDYDTYEGGWPNDNRGVNGDVIARALLSAGYDLKKLIWDDITKNPEAYPEKHGDENEAFRKIENQRIFMSRYFTPLTNDYEDIKKWQGGDIVFFEKDHGAVVADKVNNNGVRFIIHHFWKFQAGYFQDVLETDAWGKVIGHYRINKRALSPKTDTK